MKRESKITNLTLNNAMTRMCKIKLPDSIKLYNSSNESIFFSLHSSKNILNSLVLYPLYTLELFQTNKATKIYLKSMKKGKQSSRVVVEQIFHIPEYCRNCGHEI